ncbi:MAG: hypothetical protein JW904_07130 [Spirochaetales bacterium]|nr:hypothetical protein [Spirochaetales bacterium]
MAFIKKFFKFFAKLFLILGIIVLVAVAGVTIYYLVTLESAEDYLPEDFLLYVKIDSLKNIYNNVLDLKAADVIFSSGDLRSVYTALLEYRSNQFANNEFLKMLIELQASVIIHDDYSMTLALDPGALSLVTRNFGLINTFFKLDGVNLTTIQKGTLVLYKFAAGPTDNFYFSMANNLLFLSTKEENIEQLYRNKTSHKNLNSNKSLAAIKGKIEKKGLIELYASTPKLLENLFKNSPEMRPVLDRITFNELCLLSFYVSNDELRLGIYTEMDAKDDTLKTFMDYTPSSTGIIRYLPDDANIVTSLNIKSLKDLYAVMLVFQGKSLADTVEQAEGASKLLLSGASFDDLVFNWTGEEMGAFVTGNEIDPVIFVKIKDRSKLNLALKKLADSALLDQRAALVNDIPMARIEFPGLIRAIVDSFVKGIDLPYFIISDDFILFSMNPELLSKAILKYRSNKVITATVNYKTVTKDLPTNANIFSYFDLTRTLPPLIERGSMPANLLGLYEAGAMNIYFNKNELRVYINAYGIAGNKTKMLPGYPKEIVGGTKTDVLLVDVSGSGVGKLVYVDSENNLVIQDFSGNKSMAKLDGDCTLLPVRGNAGMQEIFTWARSGTIWKFNGSAAAIKPFPQNTTFQNSFSPVEVDNNLLFYSRSENRLTLFPKTGGQETPLVENLEHEVLAAPSYLNGYIAYYPKSLEPQVFLVNRSGKRAEGWPVDAASVSFCSPQIIRNANGQMRVMFLTQSGMLHLWELDGRDAPGFPVDLEGTYFTDPVMVRANSRGQDAIAVLADNGIMTIVDQYGTIVIQKSIRDSGDKQSKLVKYDIDRDGIDEIFVYGARNFIIGLDNRLEMLPGFPLPGARKPVFANLYGNSIPEMLVAGFDNRLYGYELNK